MRVRQFRWLPRMPPEAGVYETSDGIVDGFCAAVPGAHGEWHEGPIRRNVDRALLDLRAELELRRWLAERDVPVLRTVPIETRRPAA